jgi:hypothetical protein
MLVSPSSFCFVTNAWTRGELKWLYLEGVRLTEWAGLLPSKRHKVFA